MFTLLTLVTTVSRNTVTSEVFIVNENEDTWEEKRNKKTDKEINGGQKGKLNQNNKKCMLILTWATNNLCNFSFSPQLRNMNSIYPLTNFCKNWEKRKWCP